MRRKVPCGLLQRQASRGGLWVPEQPTRYSLTINRKTAAALGLTILAALLGQADELIQ